MARRTQSNQTKRFVVFAALIAFSGLVIVSYCIAKMVGKIDDLDSTKQVAVWNVTADIDDDEMEIVTGNGVSEYPITVTNDSDVASDCRIVLTGVPSGVEVKLSGDGIDSDSPLSGVVDGDKIIFSSNDALVLGFNQTKNYTIQFSAPLSTDAMSEEEISVDVELIQKDPRA